MTDTNTVPTKGFILGSALYDKVKFLVQVLLPAVGTLYFTLGNVWGWPNIEEVLGSLTAVGLFLGTVVGISSASYNMSDARFDGTVNVLTSDEGNKLFTLELDGDPADLEQKNDIVFKVRSDQLPEK